MPNSDKNDIDILKEILKEQILVPLEDRYNKKQVALTEADNYTVKIQGIPDNTVVIKSDAFPPPKAVFSNSKGECKRADFVIVADMGKKKFLIYIEMKAQPRTSQNFEVIQQFKGAQCFISYCQAIGKLFWEQKEFLDGYECRFVKIVTKSKRIDKQSSRPNNSTVHDRPDQMLTIKSTDHLQFNQLIGKPANV